MVFALVAVLCFGELSGGELFTYSSESLLSLFLPFKEEEEQ